MPNTKNTLSCSGAAITCVNIGSANASVILMAFCAFNEILFNPKPLLYWLSHGEMPMLGMKSIPQILKSYAASIKVEK